MGKWTTNILLSYSKIFDRVNKKLISNERGFSPNGFVCCHSIQVGDTDSPYYKGRLLPF